MLLFGIWICGPVRNFRDIMLYIAQRRLDPGAMHATSNTRMIPTFTLAGTWHPDEQY